LISKHVCGGTGNWRAARLFYFKLAVARVLLQQDTGFTKSIIRPVLTPLQNTSSSEQSSDNSDISFPKKKRIKRESKLSVSYSLRYDGNGHWPLFQPGKNGLRCKNEGCKQRTKWNCSKCNVHLCVHPNHNCFTSYHNEE
jgi:hypothetical protein